MAKLSISFETTAEQDAALAWLLIQRNADAVHRDKPLPDVTALVTELVQTAIEDAVPQCQKARAAVVASGLTIADAMNIMLNTSTGTKIGTGTTQKLGFYNATPVVQPTRGATLTNNVTSGGTDDTIANFTDLTLYANDAATIRNDIYQLARIVRMHDVALRALGLES